jgi:anti-anti-sigma factor
MTTGEIRYALSDGICVIQMSGKLTFTLGVSFGTFIENTVDNNAVQDVIVDLADALYMDSTILGLLGKLANCLHRRWQRKVTLCAPCENVRELLASIGFDDVFVILDARMPATAGTGALPAADESAIARAKVVRDAHMTLMNKNETNAARFRSVVEAFDLPIRTHGSTP